jgi:hypothetical protein
LFSLFFLSWRASARWFLGCLLLCLTGLAGAETAANIADRVRLHPAIPLLDEAGAHVLDSGKPYSPKTSCGEGAGCHDYAAISHGGHFERGRDEAEDRFGEKRGLWKFLSSPGYFGGFNCMGAALLAKQSNQDAAHFSGDFGAAGMVRQCGSCHNGGGWSEKDRTGMRYDQKPEAQIALWDGDYYNRGSDAHNLPAAADTVSRWDWRQSGVLENDCLMCHADYTQLKLFPGTLSAGLDLQAWPAKALLETPAAPFAAWLQTRNSALIEQGHFREAASALLEFLNIAPDQAEGANLVYFDRSLINGRALLNLDAAGKPLLHWNKSAFDAEGKAAIPMRRFPANDNCWQCHGWNVGQDRRGFHGFGEAARATFTESGAPLSDFRHDVHKGKTFTEDNGESRVMENCSVCHTQGLYYRPAFMNVDLNANHDFPKGDSDIDLRRDLDYRPGPKSCEHCHQNALHKANPSGLPTLLQAHQTRWTDAGFMFGYAANTLTRVTQAHLDAIACEACHINNLKDKDGQDIPLFFRNRRMEDGKIRSVPYNGAYQFRYYWKDKNSGRVLTQTELDSVYTPKTNAAGQVVAQVLKDAELGADYELAGGIKDLSGANAFYEQGPQFPAGVAYRAVHTLKRVYDQLLKDQGYPAPDVQMVWTESNSYLISHNTRPAVDATPCDACHNRRPNGSINGAVADNGIFGSRNVKILNTHLDRRLADEGLVAFEQPYFEFSNDNKIVANIAAILAATETAPFMSAMNANAATLASGQWMRASLEETFSRLGVADESERAKLGLELGADEAYSFNPPTADPRLQAFSLISAVSPLSQALFPTHRLEAQVSDISEKERRAIAKAGLGAVASDRYRLRVGQEGGEAVRDFNGQTVIVRLPYSGAQCNPTQVKIIAANGDQWHESGITPVSAYPNGAAGFVAFSVAQAFDALALAEPVGKNSGKNPAAALAKAAAAKAKAEKAAAAAEAEAARAEDKAKQAAKKAAAMASALAAAGGKARAAEKAQAAADQAAGAALKARNKMLLAAQAKEAAIKAWEAASAAAGCS